MMDLNHVNPSTTLPCDGYHDHQTQLGAYYERNDDIRLQFKTRQACNIHNKTKEWFLIATSQHNLATKERYGCDAVDNAGCCVREHATYYTLVDGPTSYYIEPERSKMHHIVNSLLGLGFTGR